jgi:hypothetical protein
VWNITTTTIAPTAPQAADHQPPGSRPASPTSGPHIQLICRGFLSRWRPLLGNPRISVSEAPARNRLTPSQSRHAV